MIVYKCDICKKEISGDCYFEMELRLHNKNMNTKPEEQCKNGHVCGYCVDRISKFMKGLEE